MSQVSGPISTARSRPTMVDVAKLAGVGMKTVSRVVNGEARVSAATSARVKRAIAELGFRPNAAARSLARGLSGSWGLILEDLAEPVQALMAKAIEEEVSARGRLLFTASSSRSPEREQSIVRHLTSRQIEGMIAIPTTSSQAYLTEEIAGGLHVVFVDRPPVGVNGDTVMSDNFGGTRAGVEYLVRAGHRRIAFLTSRSDTHTGIERLAGYESTLREHGIPVEKSLEVFGALDDGVIPTRLREMFASATPPTALFTASSLVSVATIRELRRLDVRPSIVGFDDFPTADILDIPLTVVAQDPAALGRTAVELLVRRLEGDNTPAQRVEIATEFVIRQSVTPNETDLR